MKCQRRPEPPGRPQSLHAEMRTRSPTRRHCVGEGRRAAGAGPTPTAGPLDAGFHQAGHPPDGMSHPSASAQTPATGRELCPVAKRCPRANCRQAELSGKLQSGSRPLGLQEGDCGRPAHAFLRGALCGQWGQTAPGNHAGSLRPQPLRSGRSDWRGQGLSPSQCLAHGEQRMADQGGRHLPPPPSTGPAPLPLPRPGTWGHQPGPALACTPRSGRRA